MVWKYSLQEYCNTSKTKWFKLSAWNHNIHTPTFSKYLLIRWQFHARWKTNLQWTMIDPASGGLLALTRLININSGVGWSGTPWSGQAVNWNWRTSRFSENPYCEYNTLTNVSFSIHRFPHSLIHKEWTSFLTIWFWKPEIFNRAWLIMTNNNKNVHKYV